MTETYSLDFKLQAISMSNKRGSRAAVTEQLNISMNTLRHWRHIFSRCGLAEKSPSHRNAQDLLIIRLRKELKNALREGKKLEKNLEKIQLEREIFEKARHYIFLKSREKYQFIKLNKDVFSVRKMCKVLEIESTGYYRWINRLPTKQSLYNQILLEEIKKVFTENKGRYGSPRITKELQAAGFKTSQPSVSKLMKTANLKVILKKRFRFTTDSSHRYPAMANKLMRQFTVKNPNQVWVSDITYIRIGYTGWLYLTAVIDLFDRKVIGWTLSQTLATKETSVIAFKSALINRPIQEHQSLIFHSDRGIQYACQEFTLEVKKHESIIQSMSRKKNMWDNAVAESFFSKLKQELIYQNKYETREQAEESIFDYIENYYNTIRRHHHLNYLTITEFQELVDDNVKDNIT